MKIALNHRYFRPQGGVERYLWTFAHTLVEGGHEAHLFCSRFAPPPPEGMIYHQVPILPLGESVKAVSFARSSRRILRGENYDGIIGFGKTIYGDVYRDGSGCMKHFSDYQRGREAGAAPPLSIKQAAFRHLERLRFEPNAFRHIVAISRMVKEQILSLYNVPEDHISVIYPGVDTARFQSGDREGWRAEVRGDYGISDGETVGVTIASGFPRKGIEPLIEALGRQEAEGWRFLILGKDKHLDRYRMLVEKSGRADRILFCGWREDVEKHLAASDFFVLNSRFDAFGNSTMEAMASALPCIVSSKAGSSEVVRDGTNGCVVSDPDNVEELAAALAKLISDRASRAKMSDKALDTAREHTIEKNVEQYLALLPGY
ncbi:glycosyltransferase family 4 protein [Planctomycetota bacterium]